MASLGQTGDMVAALSLRDVRKRYTRRGPWVLDGANLELAPATVTLVEGGNGSGKSTLLRVAGGLTAPTEGTVQRPRTVAFVPERQPAAIRFTGKEYLAHLGRIRGSQSSSGNSASCRAVRGFRRPSRPSRPDGPVVEGQPPEALLCPGVLVPERPARARRTAYRARFSRGAGGTSPDGSGTE